MAKSPYGAFLPVDINCHEGECRACDDTGWLPVSFTQWSLRPCHICQSDKYKRWQEGEDVELMETTR